MALYIGIDIGGSTIKGAVIDGDGNLYGEDSVVTVKGKDIINGIVALCNRLMKLNREEVKGIGIGCAGVINSSGGVVVQANNLNLFDFPLVKLLREKIDIPVKITNDANAAALGEAKFGAGKNYKNSILVTLGTGVGGGIVIDGKLFEGNKSAGAEIGHMVIEHGGEQCTCGRRGCFEAYSSATALKKRTKWAMEEDAGSQMWKKYTSETLTGKTAFEFFETDASAKEVVDWYVEYLACGLINLANAFRPEVIMLGGGVSKEGERLTKPLQEIVDRELFAGHYAPVKITVATLGSAAGAYGAAALCI
ncbi:MAG: ROK family protein [Clostridia bacterium]|nr:ROK family protein [Clostridia bacterium]